MKTILTGLGNIPALVFFTIVLLIFWFVEHLYARNETAPTAPQKTDELLKFMVDSLSSEAESASKTNR